ncbi:MAG: hypothetical protein ACI8TQ_000952 [Planctomycetota bacterium]|jgi:hypothetical protein
MTDDVLRLPFDQYQRYRMVADVLERLRGDGPLRVLDVGGRTALLCKFVSDNIILVDMEASNVTEGMVLGNGAQLPFQDKSFDVVCAFDTLEHVPPFARESFVKECARVSRSWCVLAGPYLQADVVRGEEILQRFLSDKLKTQHRYLDEHGEHGLPDRQVVTDWFESTGAKVECVGHGNLHRWLFMMCVELFLDDDPALRGFAGDVFAYYNEMLYASDSDEPVYRHVVVATMSGAEAPKLEGLSGVSSQNALRDPMATVALMTKEMTVFEGERDRFRSKCEEFHGIIEDREQRVSEHEKVSDELGKELAEHRNVLAARDEEIVAYRAGLAELEEANRHFRNELNWFPVKVLAKLRKLLGG